MACEAETFKGWPSEEEGDQHAKYQDSGKNMAFCVSCSPNDCRLSQLEESKAAGGQWGRGGKQA